MKYVEELFFLYSKIISFISLFVIIIMCFDIWKVHLYLLFSVLQFEKHFTNCGQGNVSIHSKNSSVLWGSFSKKKYECDVLQNYTMQHFSNSYSLSEHSMIIQVTRVCSIFAYRHSQPKANIRHCGYSSCAKGVRTARMNQMRRIRKDIKNPRHLFVTEYLSREFRL